MSGPVITKIPPKKIDLSFGQKSTVKKTRRAALYARVSTDDPEQLTSYEAQLDKYTRLINDDDDLIFVEAYADRDRSGTTTKRRADFNRMVQDAMNGKIDLIITNAVITKGRFYKSSKSAFRFAISSFCGFMSYLFYCLRRHAQTLSNDSSLARKGHAFCLFA